MTDKHVNTVRERPILFSKPMVLALLAGTKTQTRRAVKAPAWFEGHLIHAKNEHGGYDVLSDHEGGEQMLCPYGAPGDRLWVKETFHHGDAWYPELPSRAWKNCRRGGECTWVDYRATFEPDICDERNFAWTPSILMPRWASRITLEIESVRVERLQDISEDDAKAEGCEFKFIHDDPLHPQDGAAYWMDYGPKRYSLGSARESYRTLWEIINGPGSWALNSWVWVLQFRRLNPDPAKQ